MYARVLFVALGLVAAVGTAVVYYVGGNLVISGALDDRDHRRVRRVRRARSTNRSRSSRTPASTCSPRSVASSGCSRCSTSRRWSPTGPAPSTSCDPRAGSSSTTCGSVTRPAELASLAVARGGPGRAGRRPERLDPARRVASPSSRASWSRWSGRRARARRPPRCSCRASTTSARGAVRVDGHDVRDLTLESLRDAVGVVMQDPHLFHDTIRENLRYAPPGRHRRRAGRSVHGRRASTTSS